MSYSKKLFALEVRKVVKLRMYQFAENAEKEIENESDEELDNSELFRRIDKRVSELDFDSYVVKYLEEIDQTQTTIEKFYADK